LDWVVGWFQRYWIIAFFLNQRYGAANAVSSFESCYLKKWVEILVLDKWRYLAG
jgi:hypothetical protein